MVFVFCPNQHILFSFSIWVFFFVSCLNLIQRNFGFKLIIATKYFNFNSKNIEVFCWKSFHKFNMCWFSNQGRFLSHARKILFRNTSRPYTSFFKENWMAHCRLGEQHCLGKCCFLYFYRAGQFVSQSSKEKTYKKNHECLHF